VALKVAADGTLSDGSITATGGAGMNCIDSTGAPAALDALFSQGAVKVAGSVSVAFANIINFITDSRRAWLQSTRAQIQSRCLLSTPQIPLSLLWLANRRNSL
jgi:hypothetical protein